MIDPTTEQPDLRALAAAAIQSRAADVIRDAEGDYTLVTEGTIHELADAVLAAVLPAHRDMVLDEAARMILDHADKHFPADGNDVQRRARRILRIAVQVVSPKPTREQLAEKLVEMGILERVATVPPTGLSASVEPDPASAAESPEPGPPEAHGGAEGEPLAPDVVERAARAQFDADQEPEHLNAWENIGWWGQQAYRDRARAGLIAAGYGSLLADLSRVTRERNWLESRVAASQRIRDQDRKLLAEARDLLRKERTDG